MLSSKKLKPYIILGGILISLCFVIVIVISHSSASAQGLVSPDPTGTGLATGSLIDTALNIINAALALAGIIAVSVLIYGGYVWMTSGGISQRIALAKKILISAVIGLIIIILSWAIVNFIIEGATGGEGGPGIACTEGAESGCYDCNGGSWSYDNSNSGCLFGDLFTVKWVDPIDGASNVPLCRIVQAGFSKNVNTTTIDSSNAIIQMSCTDDPQCLNVMGVPNLGTCIASMCSGNIAAMPGAQFNFFDALGDEDSDPDAFEFIPPAEWEPNRTYRINLTTGVTSASGTPLSAAFVSTFSTGSTTDNTAPQVANIVPTPGGINICRMKPISVVFNEPMRASTLKDMATLAVTEIELPANKDYAALEFSKSDGTISPADLTFSSSIPSPWSVNYSPKKPYDKNAEYFPILRAGEDIDGDKTLDAGEDLNGNKQLDGIQDACRNFLDQNQLDSNYGSPKGDYGEYQGDADDDADIINYSFTTENSDDFQCDPEIASVETSPFYYDPPDPLDAAYTNAITIRGKNFGLAGDVLLKDSIAVNFGNNLCLEESSDPSYTNTGRACVIPANWTDDRITLIAPARTQIGMTLGGAIDGPIQVDLGGFAECSGMPLVCQAGRNKDKTCGSDNDCPVGKSNLMAVDIASPHISKMSPTAGPKGQWITLKGTDFGAAPGTVRFINTADRTQWVAGNFPCTAGWTDTNIIVELPIDAVFGPGDIEIQIERSDGRHSNFGTFTVNTDPLGPGICSISRSCGEIGTTFNIEGKRFGTAGGNVVFRNDNTAAETLVAINPPDWGDDAIQDVAVPVGLPDAPYSIMARVAGFADSNPGSFKKPCPGTPCDGDTIAPSCQPDQTICDAIGPTYSCNTATCRCVNNPLPKVVEQNSCILGTQSPSPYIGQIDACRNSWIGMRFNKDMNDATLTLTNVSVETCSDAFCTISTPVNISTWIDAMVVWGDNGEEAFAFKPGIVTLLNLDTYYRVTLCSGPSAGICTGAAGITANNYPLDGNGNGIPDGPGPGPLGDDYSWIFKTSNDSCKVKSIILSPANISIAVSSSKPISAIPQAENCNALVAYAYDWNWSSANAATATVSTNDNERLMGLIDPTQQVTGVKAGTTTVSASIPAEPAVTAGTSNITVTNKLSCSDAGLTAVWKFDEAAGDAAVDSTDNNNQGVLRNSPTRLSTGCKFGKCLEFDGVEDYVNVGAPSSLSFNNKSFSVESWVKIKTLTDDAVDEGIVADYRDGVGGGRWMLDKKRRLNGAFRFFLDPNGTWMDGDERIAVGSTIPVEGAWYHVAGVYNHSTGDVKLYVNGFLENTASGFPVSIGAVNNVTIGDWYDLNGNRTVNGAAPINGSIDEVRIWNKALDISEIKSIYNQQCEALDKISCSDPNLKAVWKLDENSGIAANDSTANNNDGQLNNNPAWKSGADCKPGYGSCLSFDGSDDYISVSDNPIFNFNNGTNDKPFTFETWIKRSDETRLTEVIFSKYYTDTIPYRAQYWFRIVNSGDLDLYIISSGGTGDIRKGIKTNGQPLRDTAWHHIAGTYDGSKNVDGLKLYIDGALMPISPADKTDNGAYVAMSPTTEPLMIGRYTDNNGDGENFYGAIDEPRVWDKALTQEEIISAMSQSCLAGGAGQTIQCTNDVVGLWNFDEGGGSFVGDGSRYRNNGMLIPIQNAGWSTGCQFGGCVKLDGTTQYIDVSNPPALNFGDGTNDKPFTFEAWVKRSEINPVLNPADVIFSKYNSQSNPYRQQYSFDIDAAGQLEIAIFDTVSSSNVNIDQRRGIRTSTQPLNNTNWHHVAATYNGSKTNAGLKLYVDGIEQATTVLYDEITYPNYVAMDATSESVKIGRNTDSGGGENYFDGTIDEVRIYNRTLSAAEIANTYQKSMTQCVEATLMCSNPELTAVWKMDEGIGVVAGDSTKNNLDGALKNGLNNTGWKSGADCKFTDGKCLEFDGINNAFDGIDSTSDGDYIRVPDSSTLDFGVNPFTIEGWVKMPPSPACVALICDGGYRSGQACDVAVHNNGPIDVNFSTQGCPMGGTVIAKQSSGSNSGFVVHTNTTCNNGMGKLYFRVNNNTTNDDDHIICSPKIDDNEWHHFAAVREGNIIRMYIDGNRAGENRTTGTSVDEIIAPDPIINVDNNYPLYVGVYRNGIDDTPWASPFKGSLDELRIWKKALTDNQIQSIYNGGNGQQCLAPQKGSACDLDLAAPMCQPNVGLCESGDPDLRCSIKSCTCQEAFTVNPPPLFTYDSRGVVGGLACRNTAITVNFNENIDAGTIKTATTTLKVKNPPLLSENFEAGLPAGWTTTQTGGGAGTLVWEQKTVAGPPINSYLYEQSDDAAGWFVSPNALSSTTNFRVSFDAGSSGALNEFIGLAWNYIDDNNYYRIVWEDPNDTQASLRPSRLILQKKVNGNFIEKDPSAAKSSAGEVLVEKNNFIASISQSVHFDIDVNGTKITVFADGKQLLSYNDSQASAILPGKIAFYTNDNDGGIFYDNLVVIEYEATNIPGTVELYALQQASGNLLADGDMERTDTDVWKTYGTPAVVEKRTTPKHGGARSLYVRTDDHPAVQEGVYASAGTVNAGDQVRMRGWYYASNGSVVAAFAVGALPADLSTLPTTGVLNGVSAWKEFALDWNATSSGPLSAVFYSTPQNANDFNIDDVSVTIEHNLAVDISTAVNGSQLTISPRQFLDPERNYTVNLRGDNLSALWNFEEASGTTVKDLHGTNNGTLVGPPLWKSGADCKFGSCLEFDGKDGVIQYVNAGDFTGKYSDRLTVSAWIKNNSSRVGMSGNNAGWDDIIAGDCGNFVFAVANAGKVKFQNQCGFRPGTPQGGVVSDKSVNDDRWHHVAATYDGSTMRMYVDGKPDGTPFSASGSFQANVDSGIIWIGSTFYNEELFSGRIDDARIWSRALTDKEIADVAKGGAPNPGNGNVIFSSNGNPLENDYVWNGLTTGTEICKIGKVNIEFDKDGDPSAGWAPMTYASPDLFTCAGINNCPDDITGAQVNNQHTARAMTYAANGGLLGGPIDYAWTPSADAPFVINSSGPPDQAMLVTPNSTNGSGTLTVKTDQLDGGSSIIGTANATANINVQLCENPWPAVPTDWSIFPFQDVPAATSTNFSLWYCRDAGNMQDLTDDLPSLTVQAVVNSPGSPKPMKEYFYYDIGNTNDAIGIRVYANPARLPLTEWLDQNANVSGGQSGMFNGWQSVRAGRSLYVSAMNDVGSGIYNNIYLISYSDKSSSTLIGIYNQMIGNWKFMVNGISDADIAKLQRDIRRIDDLGKIATALDSYKTKNGSYPKLDAGTYLPGMSTSVWPSWQASFGNALQTSIPKDPINRLGNLNVWWKFDETTGMDIIDSGLNGYNGRMEGTIQRVSGGNCKFGGCLDFGNADQINNIIRMPSEAANGLEDFTTDFWVKTNAEIGTVISGAKDAAGNNEFTVYWDNPNPGCVGLCPILYTSFSHGMQPINDGAWHHIAWTKSGDASRVYIDGIWKDTKVIPSVHPIDIPSGGLVIGQEQDIVGGSFEARQSMKGLLDELRIWNRALSGSEIALLAGGGFSEATGWNQDTNSFRCDAGTDFNSHIYHYQYNNANSYNLYGALEYVGPNTGNTWRQRHWTFASPNDVPYAPCTNPSNCACYNYKVSCPGKIQDADGNTYSTISINNQCWMKENLRKGTRIAGSFDQANNGIVEKYCYNNDDADCVAYGGLYQWDEAMNYGTIEGAQGICPAGWHIPTDAEQYSLENYLKDTGQTCDAARNGVWQCATAGTKLKSGGSSGFEGLLAGDRDTAGSFLDRDKLAYFWSSNQSVAATAFHRYLFSLDSAVLRGNSSKTYGFSIRCIKD